MKLEIVIKILSSIQRAMRLNKFLARAGIASRRKCDQLIEAGKVIINGRVALEFSYQVDSNDIIICDGIPIETIPKRRIYIVNKLIYLHPEKK